MTESTPALTSRAQAVVANKVLILASTVVNGASSQEAVAATRLGMAVEVVTPAQWAAKTSADFATYRAIILGDPNCGSATAINAAVTNRNTWGPVVNGNVVIVGTAPVFYQRTSPGPVTMNAVELATAQADKTGAYISLSCYYAQAPAGTAVTVLEPFGTFTVQRPPTCLNNAHLVGTHPLLSDLNDAAISNWNCSAQELFDGFPRANFVPLAIAKDASETTRYPGSLSFADGTHGPPYMLARGVTQVGCGNGTVEAGEQCDLGAANGVPGNACSASCQQHWCGDGVVDASEQCDEGAANGAGSCTAACRSFNPNRPPVARCKPLVLNTGATCGATGSIDDGSSDPDNNLLSCTQSPAGPWGPGTTTVMLTCRDTGGLTSTCTSTVTVTDATPPAISCPTAQVAECNGQGARLTPAQALAQDNCGAATVAQPGETLFPLGSTEVSYTATDSAGNTASCQSTVTVQDTLGPDINLNGAGTSWLECALGRYTEQGATATDRCYGDATATLTISGSVDTRSPGSYYVAYTAHDPNGLSSTVYRQVSVEDSLAPTLTLNGASVQPVECDAQGNSYVELGAVATDACSGDLTGRVQVNNAAVDGRKEGDYPVTYRVFDEAENYATAARTVSVRDTLPPVITCPAAKTAECVAGSATVDPGEALAVDACALESISRHGPASFAQGTHSLEYVARDRAGHTASCAMEVSVVDTLPPSITMTGGVDAVLECAVDTYVEPGVSAVDVCAGDLSASVSAAGQVNAAAVGVYPVTYTAVDPAGNVQTSVRNVHVNDSRPPAITLRGESAVQLECGVDGYREAGAQAMDACSGDLSSSIRVDSSRVNARAPGSYAVSYSVADPSGNRAVSSRQVTVADTLPPQIALLGDAAPVLECAADSYVEAGAVATDACAGDVSSSIVVSGQVNPAAVGDYALSYTARDGSGHAAQAVRAVKVRDTRKPTIALRGPARLRLECGVDTYAELGATAWDTCGGDVSGSLGVDSSGVQAGATGTYEVAYTAADPSGNTAAATRTVDVVDTLRPMLALVGPADMTLDCGAATFVDPGVIATDACSGDLSGSVVRTGAVDPHRPGAYVLTYNVKDAAGLSAATVTRTVRVLGGPTEVVVTASLAMWPPNHRMDTFQLSDCAAIRTSCSGTQADINALGRITSISSDEPEDARGGGDGSTTGDIQITGQSSFQLRVEREGGSNGRVYSVNFVVGNGEGGLVNGVCKFTVPHDQSGRPAVDDGAAAGYTVYSR